MSQTNKIQFLLRMERANALFQGLADYLVAEKITTRARVAELFRQTPQVQAQEMYLMLSDAHFMLVDWEWTILPAEHMKLTLVTHNGVKEFAHDE